MNKKTLKALDESIVHWEENSEAKKPYHASAQGSDCALCKMFYLNGSCKKCPVYEKTGLTECVGSPYSKAYHTLVIWRNETTLANGIAFREAAQKQLKFLKSLRPAKEKQP